MPPLGNRRQRRGRGDRKTTELASTIRSALEHTILLDLFPRAQIGVSVQVLQADGGVLGACINAAMLALACAGTQRPISQHADERKSWNFME